MKIRKNGKVIELYDSIMELPIKRFMLYNLNVIIDSGIGSDHNGIHNKINLIRRLVDVDGKKAKMELENMRIGLVNIMSQVNPELRSFMALIKVYDGKEIGEIDEDKMKELFELINRDGWAIGMIKKILEKVKKKITKEFEV
jgi:hypothetical protein